MLHTNTTTGSADLGAIVDGLDLDNELFGLTEDDDGKSVSLVGTSAPATIIEDESTDAPVIAVATPAPVVVAPGVPSKAQLARAIFVANYGKLARKDVIKAFIAQAGLTDKGAATYYQNFTKDVKDGKLVIPA